VLFTFRIDIFFLHTLHTLVFYLEVNFNFHQSFIFYPISKQQKWTNGIYARKQRRDSLQNILFKGVKRVQNDSCELLKLSPLHA